MPRLRIAALNLVLLTIVAIASPNEARTQAAKSAPSRNLLGNPGFERAASPDSWMPAAWDTSEAALPTVFFGRDTFLVHSGRYSANVANASTLFPIAHNWSQSVLVGREAWGKDAVFSIWTRSNGLEGRAYVIIQAYRDTVSKMSRIWGVDRPEAAARLGLTGVNDPLIDLGWQRQQFSENETPWVRREVRTFVPRGTNVLFVRGGLFGTGQVIFDDASLTLVPARPEPVRRVGENMLADSGFEEGTGNLWEHGIPPFENARIDVDSTTAHTGTRSMRLSGAQDGLVQVRMGACQNLPARSLVGKRVRISAFLKGDSLQTNAYVKVYASTLDGVKQTGAGRLLSGTFDWTEAALEWDVPPGTERLWAWAMCNAPFRGTMWIDDFTLTVIGDAIGEHAPVPAPPKRPAAPRKKK